MIKQLIKLLFLILIMASCDSKMNNPLMDFQIGEEERIWKNKIEKNLLKGVISQQYDDENIFRYYFINGKDSIYTDVHINSDSYYYGKLRILKFDLRDDTTYIASRKYFDRSSGPRDIKTVDKLLSWFIEYYGEPTDSIPVTPRDRFPMLFDDENITPEGKYREIFEIQPKPGSFIWEKENFTIEFYRKKAERFLNDTTPATRYRDANVIYKIHGYEKELKKITEPIRANFKAEDVARVIVDNPKWEQLRKNSYWDYDYKFVIDIEHVIRSGKEEPRKITDVQFDIILTDAFGKELCRLVDLDLKLSEPVELNLGAFMTGDNRFVYSKAYNSLYKDELTNGLEQARKLHQNNRLKFYTKVKAVVFEDGEILR